MTITEAMDGLKARLELIASSKGATDAQVRAAMLVAITDGVGSLKVGEMAKAAGLHTPMMPAS